MSSEPTSPAAPTEPAPFLVAERAGTRTYRGRNERGGEVLMGPLALDGAFTPGELLAIALAGCTGMSADSRIAADLGEDVAITVGVDRSKVEEDNRYDALAVELVIHAPHSTEADPERLARMLTTTQRAIDQLCTVSRTLEAGARVSVVITPEEGAEGY